jgi:hypothetical protein
MAWLKRIGRLPSTTLIRLAGLAAIVGLVVLGIGIGTGWWMLLIAAYAVIFTAGLVPDAVDWRDSITASAGGGRPGKDASGGRVACPGCAQTFPPRSGISGG